MTAQTFVQRQRKISGSKTDCDKAGMKAKKIFAANGTNTIIFVKVSGEFVMKSGLYQTNRERNEKIGMIPAEWFWHPETGLIFHFPLGRTDDPEST